MDLINEMNKTVERIVQTISSREVAEMMEKRHDHLIRDIEKHTAILEKVNEPNFGVVDLWQLSSYKDAKGETRKEYQVTKKGCEFLAHKTTGEKGDLFTIRYMNKFEEMEQYINSDEQSKANLLLEIYNGGQNGVLASKQLVELETKPLQETIQTQSNTIGKLIPLANFANSVQASKQSILVGELAKLLKQNGIDIGQNRLFEWLRENGYLIKRKGSSYNMPTQKSMELGLFEIKETCITHADGHTSISKTPKVTGKGQIYFVNKFKKVS